MMYSSSNINGDSDCFGAHNGFISPSTYQLGSSSSSALFEEDHFFVDNFFSMSQGQQKFLLGHDQRNTDHLALIDHNYDFAIVAGSFEGNNQISCDLVGEEACYGQKNSVKAVGSLSSHDIDEKECQPVKRPKRIRTGKKDRHSKICTAQGPRDRRMRLSLQIARKFFDLQDKLGFDKASKTIEWLFDTSKNAIREVMEDSNSRLDEPKRYGDASICISSENRWNSHLVPPLSGFEDALCSSQFEHITNNRNPCNYLDFQVHKGNKITKHSTRSESKKFKSSPVPNWPQMKKDDRDKARAWARERTVEKIRLKALKDPNDGSVAPLLDNTATANQPNNHSFSEQIGSCSAFEHIDSGAQSQSVELIHAEWKEIEDAITYSSYMFPTTPNQHQFNNVDQQSPDTVSFTSSASQIFTNQLSLSTTTSTNND